MVTVIKREINAFVNDTMDKNRVLSKYGPSMDRCVGGRLIVVGFICPHCPSNLPGAYCEAPASSGE